MCKKAAEIQDSWVFARGDTFVHHLEGAIIEKVLNPIYLFSRNNLGRKGIDYGGCLIWLPRQDQLQEMIEWKKIFIVKEGKEYQQRSLGDILLRANSMEQLWLAFVMKEKFNKRWDNKKWVTA